MSLVTNISLDIGQYDFERLSSGILKAEGAKLFSGTTAEIRFYDTADSRLALAGVRIGLRKSCRFLEERISIGGFVAPTPKRSLEIVHVQKGRRTDFEWREAIFPTYWERHLDQTVVETPPYAERILKSADGYPLVSRGEFCELFSTHSLKGTVIHLGAKKTVTGERFFLRIMSNLVIDDDNVEVPHFLQDHGVAWSFSNEKEEGQIWQTS